MPFGPYKDVETFASVLAGELCAGDSPSVQGDANTTAKRIVAGITANFRAVAEVDREVERQIEALGSQAAGMDEKKLRSGLRERIAKQKGVVL